MPEYRKGKSSDTWHWCANCSTWPSVNFVVEYRAGTGTPEVGELCNECKAKAMNGNCSMSLSVSAVATSRRRPAKAHNLTSSKSPRRLTLSGLVAIGAALATIIGLFVWVFPSSCRAGYISWGICNWYRTQIVSPPTPTVVPTDTPTPVQEATQTLEDFIKFIRMEDWEGAHGLTTDDIRRKAGWMSLHDFIDEWGSFKSVSVGQISAYDFGVVRVMLDAVLDFDYFESGSDTPTGVCYSIILTPDGWRIDDRGTGDCPIEH